MNKSEDFHSATIPDSSLMRGILGLRGLAALAVVLFHICHLTGINVPEGLLFIERDFGYGAQLFFVISAFSLMHSTERTMHRPDWIRDYLIKRFFRIAPLFYTMLVCMLIIIMVHAVRHDALFTVSIFTIFLNVFFVFGFFPNPEIGLVMGGWTIGAEMIFYVLFPVILIMVKNSRQALALLLLVISISYAARYQMSMDYLKMVPLPKWDWSYFSFIANLYFFAFGVYAYRACQELKNDSITARVVIPGIAIGLIGILMLVDFDELLKSGGRLDLVIWAAGFTALCIWQSKRPTAWIASKFFEYAGERSYSLYLLHPVIIITLKKYIVGAYFFLVPFIGTYAFFVCAVAVLLLVGVVAELTYRFIEVPGINFGRNLILMQRDKTLVESLA